MEEGLAPPFALFFVSIPFRMFEYVFEISFFDNRKEMSSFGIHDRLSIELGSVGSLPSGFQSLMNETQLHEEKSKLNTTNDNESEREQCKQIFRCYPGWFGLAAFLCFIGGWIGAGIACRKAEIL